MNALPAAIQEALEKELEGVSLKKILPFVEKLSQFYRLVTHSLPPIQTKEEHLAYLATRLPATYAALFEVLQRLPFQPKTVLDLGAGPGTAWMAANELFSLDKATLVERDGEFLELGKKLCGNGPKWVAADYTNYEADEQYDLVVLSYTIGELQEEAARKIVEKAISWSKGAVVIVEPGTPRGYETIIRARTVCIENGATLLAPCPHMKPCPLTGADWCHFRARLSRTKIHQYLKSASLGYEDEKFSYIIASKTYLQNQPYDRLIREPQHRSGHSLLTLCTHNGAFQEKTVSRRDKELYSAAKRAEWGDTLPA